MPAWLSWTPNRCAQTPDELMQVADGRFLIAHGRTGRGQELEARMAELDIK